MLTVNCEKLETIEYTVNFQRLLASKQMILPKKFAGGTTSVPGPKGAGDVVPAMLSPGESVIPTKQTQKYAGFINQIIQE
jgi:hypothetical protein